LHQRDCEASGFQWVEANAAEESVFAWLRFGEDGAAPVLAISNFTPVERPGWRVGVPAPGHWAERLNTDAEAYGGGGRGNLGGVRTTGAPANGRSDSIEITLPPLTTVFFEHAGN
ncbi:MAG: alpha amylase C-terminal domain-containing protein, partial [Paracoccaceae bacterium]